MKNIVKSIAITAAVLGFANSTFAQASATASVSANIVTPITIVKTIDMHFGNLAVSATVAGTAIMAPGSTRSTGGAGGVSLPANTGTVSAATFTVSGEPTYTYSITLPSVATITDASSHSMTVNTFTSNPSSTGVLSGGGAQTLTVGATLNVAAGQASGTYSNSTGVPVTVNYN